MCCNVMSCNVVWCDVTWYDVMYVWTNVCMCFTHVMHVMCVLCAMICYAMSGSFRFCHAVSWYVMLWSAMLPYGMLCHIWWATLCYVMLCHVMCVCVYGCMLCHVMLWSAMWHVIEGMCMYDMCVMNVTLCNTIMCYAMLCYVYVWVCMSTYVYVGVRHAMSSHVMLCYAMFCYVYMFVCVCKRVMWCYAMVWKAMVRMLCIFWMLCCAMICYVMLWHAVWSYVILCVLGTLELGTFHMVDRWMSREIHEWHWMKYGTVTPSEWSAMGSLVRYASGMVRSV